MAAQELPSYLPYRKPTLAERMRNGEFLVSVQIDPPSVDEGRDLYEEMNEFWEMIFELKHGGAVLLDVNSSKGKKDKVYMDSILLVEALRHTGFEVIPHVTARHTAVQNLLRMIESAYALSGVSDFLIITGDPHDINQSIPPRGVEHVDAIGALDALNRYLRPRDAFSLAAAVSQNNDLRREGLRLRRKVMVGVDFFMSQPIFSEGQFEKLVRFYRKYSKKPLIVGIWPLVSCRTINGIRKGKIVGVVIPPAVLKEAERYFEDDDKLMRWGMENAALLSRFIKRSGKAQGVYIVAPSRNPLLALEIWKRIQ